MSSSPLPSLSDLLTNGPQASRSRSPTAPSPCITSAYFSGVANLSKSRELAKVQKINSTDPPESLGAKESIIDGRLIDEYVNNENTHLEISSKIADQSEICSSTECLMIAGSRSIKVDRLSAVESELPTDKVTKPRKAAMKIMDKVEAESKFTSQGKDNETKLHNQRSVQKKSRPKIKKTTQSKLQKGKVTKSSVLLIPASKSKETVGFAENLLKKSDKQDEIHIVDESQEWIPSIKEYDSNNTPLRDHAIGISISSDAILKIDQNKKVINSLFEEFAYVKSSKSSKSSNEKRKSKENTIGKRKLIELVKSTTTAPSKIKGKEKALKKKARTLTELSTTIFEEEQEPQTSLVKYLHLQGSEDNLSKLKFSASSSSEASVMMKSTTGQTPKSVLLSPESAIRLVSKQDFVFGTSSQLAREESPTFLRDSHKQTQTSNHLSDPFSSSPIPSLTIKSKKSSQSLWNAASRDSNGNLLNIELVDLAISPNKPDTIDLSPIFAGDPSLEIGNNHYNTNITSLPQSNSHIPTSIDNDQHPGNQDDVLVLPCSPPKENSKSQKTAKCRQISTNKASVRKAVDERPNYESYTNAQLAKEISAYHFKPVKKREQMINLLQKCWLGKQEMKSKTSSANSRIDITTTCAEACGSENSEIAPFKKTTKEKQKKETRREPAEILGVKSCSSLSSETRTPEKSRKKSKTKSSISEVEAETCRSTTYSPSPELSPASVSQLLFRHITQAIKNTAPSKEAKNPSWYEKILLYDPIVIEDLTVWLNTGALQKTNWDGEVDPKVVKKWCESKSICCLWRENLRGGARNRY
ncbi:Structure-specific endonuclease subunit slx4 [Erysiphe neolycopersici]|uniref:Structure-specific endonuclease subunit SLX4 n=1 Tax=Erysiphe neolycopersici TaxID=212602 RepID=A0A420HCN1_9PEZI|nr:Structure-specific endonuclease subunit slx4 [Erysiphe neolycopersici]